jgi:N-acetylglucosamine-6-sulfatase
LYPESKVEDHESRILFGFPLSQVVNRLDALLMVLKSCRGVTCINPWGVLHPAGDIQNLFDALSSRYDVFYQSQIKVAYDRCEFGYIIDAEGPQIPLTFRDGIDWHHWV